MIPKTLKINGRKWKVVVEEQEDRGHCDHDARVITVADRLDKQDAEETFIHELLHALIPEQECVWTEKQEELVVELLAPRLLATLKSMGAWK